ncbi:MAG: hypothetical protein ABSE56_00550 [Bryobacteraceae bacterium]|jgi:predicted anti-sigma-YlaC factor YlaD
MHGLIREYLEEGLLGVPGKQAPVEVEQHLRGCEACRDELNGMREQTRLLRTLQVPDPPEQAPGFYARVLERIEARRTGSIWSAFLDPVFGRRLVATSLALMVLLGGYLAFTETSAAPPATAVAIIAVQDHPPGLGEDRQRDRDTMLVTLATYHE